MISLVTQLYVVEHDLEIAYTLSKYLIFPLKKKSVLMKQLVLIQN